MEKYTGYIVTALLVIVVVLFGTFIGSDTPNIDVNVNIDGSQPSSIGALGDPNPTSLDADEWTAMNDLYIDDLEVSDDALISGNLEVSGSLVVDGDLSSGVGVAVISTSSATRTLTAEEICGSSYIEFTPLGAAVTLTLPATSTITTCLQTAGIPRTIIIENAAGAATTTTIAAGTGMDLQENDGQNVVIEQNDFATLTFWKRSDTDIVVTVNETIPAD